MRETVPRPVVAFLSYIMPTFTFCHHCLYTQSIFHMCTPSVTCNTSCYIKCITHLDVLVVIYLDFSDLYLLFNSCKSLKVRLETISRHTKFASTSKIWPIKEMCHKAINDGNQMCCSLFFILLCATNFIECHLVIKKGFLLLFTH